MEVLVKLPEDLNKYFEYIPVDSLPEVILDLVRTALKSKLEFGLKEEGQATSEDMLKTLLSQISTMNSNAPSVPKIQQITNSVTEVSNTTEDIVRPTEATVVKCDVALDDEDDFDDYFR